MEKKQTLVYLILGIGIGIIITNILHSFYPSLEYIEVSEMEIMERAKELGMVSLKESIAESSAEKTEKIEDEEKDIIYVKEIIVESGSGLTRVANKLYDAKLIDDKEAFILFVKEENLDKKIITGNYYIEDNTSYSEIIKILTDTNR